MRITTLALNLMVVVFFICFLAYTAVARPHLESLARKFVTERTLEYSQPLVAGAVEALGSPVVRKLLSDDQESAIRHELAEYQNDPGAYVADLTRQQLRDVPAGNAVPLIDKVVSVKTKIRTYYDNTLNALIADLRIFSSSNLLAGLIAFVLAYRSAVDIRKRIVWFSFLLFVAVLCCSYLYLDNLTFFRILFRAHLGWWYAALLCVMVVDLYWDFGHHRNATEQGDAREAANSAAASGESTMAGR